MKKIFKYLTNELDEITYKEKVDTKSKRVDDLVLAYSEKLGYLKM